MKLYQQTTRMRLFMLCLILCITVCAIVPLNSSYADTTITASEIKLNCAVGVDNVILTWNHVTNEKGVKGYYVYRSTTSGGQTILPETDFWIAGTSYVDTKVTPGTTYYYIVKPVLGDGYVGRASNEVKAYYQGNNPSITLRATVNTGNITLDWSNSNIADVIGYYVFRSTKSGEQTNLPETDFWITGTSYVDTKVVPGTTYYYIVKPVMKDKSLGIASNEVEIKSQRIYGTIAMTIGKAIMLVNGQYLEIDPGKATVPVLKNARTMLPIRALIEAMGGIVDYVSGEEKVTVKWNGKTVCVWIGKKTYTVDGVQKTMDVAPYYSDTGRTMLPMRFIIENLGCSIDWDGSTYTATVSYLLDNSGYYPPTPPEYSTSIWAGTWFTDRGKIVFNQNGIYVNGTYGNGNTIEGVVSGDKLIGSYVERNYKGELEFVISKDGESFDGKYSKVDKQKKQWLKWNGKREADTYNKYLRQLSWPADFNGTWSVKSLGKIIISQQDNTVSGTLGNKERISGTVANNKFTGTYIKGNTAYQIEIYMLEGNKVIVGHYGTSEIARQDWKEFSGEICNSKDYGDCNHRHDD